MNRSKSSLGSVPLGPIYGNGVKDADTPDALALMASTPLLRPRNELSFESVVIRACGGSESHAPLMSYLELESRLSTASVNDKVSVKALAEMEKIFSGSAREVVLHLSMMAPERARLTERMFSFYASLFPRLLPSLACLEEESSRLRSIVDKETEQRARVGKIMTDWCGNSTMESSEQRLRKGLLKALASCDEGKEDKGARSCWAPVTEYLFRQAQSMVKELDFASTELASAIPPAKLEAAQQATAETEKRLKDSQEKLQEEQKAHAETRHQNLLQLSEMTEEWNAKLRDASEKVARSCLLCSGFALIFWQVAQHQSASQTEMFERESKTQATINELSNLLSAARQSSEQQLAENVALRSTALGLETQLAEQVQSESHFCMLCARACHVADAHAENRSLDLQHQETMRSTQTALSEAQSELEKFVQVLKAALSHVACSCFAVGRKASCDEVQNVCSNHESYQPG